MIAGGQSQLRVGCMGHWQMGRGRAWVPLATPSLPADYFFPEETRDIIAGPGLGQMQCSLSSLSFLSCRGLSLEIGPLKILCPRHRYSQATKASHLRLDLLRIPCTHHRYSWSGWASSGRRGRWGGESRLIFGLDPPVIPLPLVPLITPFSSIHSPHPPTEMAGPGVGKSGEGLFTCNDSHRPGY